MLGGLHLNTLLEIIREEIAALIRWYPNEDQDDDRSPAPGASSGASAGAASVRFHGWRAAFRCECYGNCGLGCVARNGKDGQCPSLVTKVHDECAAIGVLRGSEHTRRYGMPVNMSRTWLRYTARSK